MREPARERRAAWLMAAASVAAALGFTIGFRGPDAASALVLIPVVLVPGALAFGACYLLRPTLLMPAGVVAMLVSPILGHVGLFLLLVPSLVCFYAYGRVRPHRWSRTIVATLVALAGTAGAFAGGFGGQSEMRCSQNGSGRLCAEAPSDSAIANAWAFALVTMVLVTVLAPTSGTRDAPATRAA